MKCKKNSLALQDFSENNNNNNNKKQKQSKVQVYEIVELIAIMHTGKVLMVLNSWVAERIFWEQFFLVQRKKKLW